MYRKVESTSPFGFEARAGLFRLSTNEKFNGYLLDLLEKNIFRIKNTVNPYKFTVHIFLELDSTSVDQ